MSSPLFIDARAVAAALPWGRLIDALWSAFRNADDTTVPQRLHCSLRDPSEQPAVLLLMPAWHASLGVGTKLVSVFPGNARLGLPSVQGLYVLMDPRNGRPLAVLDGGELTARRTAAASALASRYLSRPDSRCLLMVGTGRLARHLPLAHAQTRPIERVLVWGRSALQPRPHHGGPRPAVPRARRRTHGRGAYHRVQVGRHGPRRPRGRPPRGRQPHHRYRHALSAPRRRPLNRR
jgi:ornithine cyclodeaminase/alanine dehydrogenase-like protein (mu-crystallin family)